MSNGASFGPQAPFRPWREEQAASVAILRLVGSLREDLRSGEC